MKTAVIADLDGTLCDVSGILHFVEGEGEERDFAAFHAASADCPPHDEVADAVRSAHGAGHAVLIVTSREFVWRDVTLDWLVAHEIPYDELVMRIVGDYRADDIVKAEMLDQIEADGWSVTEAWEDSADIIELWKSRGITVHAV